MKIDFTQKLVNPFTKEPVWESEKKEKESTLSGVCSDALLTKLEGDERATGKDKMELFLLAQKIYNAKDADLTAEEVAKIKERVGKSFAAIMVGIVYPLLDK